jgi:hypothetical protein
MPIPGGYMDPNYFHVDSERLLEVLATVTFFAFAIERALAVFFESRLVSKQLDKSGAKEIIAFGVSLGVCWYWHFDALSVVLVKEQMTIPGYFITAGLVAGGSKASIKLFHDGLGIMSLAEEARKGVKPPNRKAQVPDAGT